MYSDVYSTTLCLKWRSKSATLLSDVAAGFQAAVVVATDHMWPQPTLQASVGRRCQSGGHCDDGGMLPLCWHTCPHRELLRAKGR